MITPDGRTLVSGHGGTITSSDIANGAVRHTVKIDALHVIAVSHDGGVLATAGVYTGKSLVTGKPVQRSDWETVVLWDLSTGRRLHTLRSSTYCHVQAAAFSPDGRTLAIGLEPLPELYDQSDCRETVMLWDVASGRELRLLEGDLPGREGPGVVRSVAFSPDGLWLASGPQAGDIKLWDVATGARMRTLASKHEPIEAIAFSPDGWTLASGSESGAIAFWDLGSERKPYRRPYKDNAAGNKVTAVAFSPDGIGLASGAADGTITLWDRWSGRELHVIAAHAEPIWSLAFAPDSVTLASESEGTTIRIWDVRTGRELRCFEPAL